jgi:hypothetical protein
MELSIPSIVSQVAFCAGAPILPIYRLHSILTGYHYSILQKTAYGQFIWL